MARLEGSEKQVAWAEDIRRAVLAAVERSAGDATSEAELNLGLLGLDRLESQMSAAWWIEHQGPQAALRAVISRDEMQAAMAAAQGV